MTRDQKKQLVIETISHIVDSGEADVDVIARKLVDYIESYVPYNGAGSRSERLTCAYINKLCQMLNIE